MGKQINLNGVQTEAEDRVYIKQAGNFTLKVVKVTFGKTNNNNETIKVHFQNNKMEYITDEFVLTDNALWKLKLLTKALKLPNIIDTDMFINRYVGAEIVEKTTRNGGVIFQIKKYAPSKLTNTYEPPVEYEHQNQPVATEDDEVPF